MNDAVLFQCAGAPVYQAMLDATFKRHCEYAAQHHLTYEWYGTHYPETLRAWDKFYYLLDLAQRGYEYLFYLDADAVITDEYVDLRTPVRRGGLLNCTWHTGNGDPDHFNVGVILACNHPALVRFLQALLAELPTPEQAAETGPWRTHRFNEQVIFNRLVAQPDWRDLIQPLDARFNSTRGYSEVPRPTITAFHGWQTVEDRLHEIQALTAED